MKAVEELKRVRKDREALKKKIETNEERFRDTLSERVEQEKEFNLQRAISENRQLRQEYADLECREKELVLVAEVEELGKQKKALERTIDELEEEKRAEQKIIDEYLPTMTEVEKELTEDLGGIWMHRRLKDHVATIQKIDMIITQRGLEISDIDDQIEARVRIEDG